MGDFAVLLSVVSVVALVFVGSVAYMIADSESPPRFGLRSLLLIVTLAAIVIGLLAAAVRN